MSAEPAAPPAAVNEFDVHGQMTTRRGLATVSFSFALWGLLVFWWYPFGLTLGVLAVIIGSITWGLGIRAGKDGEHLAIGGVLIGSCTVGAALAVHRIMQLYFEGSSIAIP
jgi:hypothetical protein